MTDQDWGDLDALPARKSGAPRWLWFCGGGCLLMLLTALGAGWGLVSWYKAGARGEDRLDRLAKVLPHDELSEDFDLKFAQVVPFSEIEFFLFTASGFGDPEGRGREDEEEEEDDDDPEELEDEESTERGPGRRGSDALFVVFMYVPNDDDGDEGDIPELVDPDDEDHVPMRIQGRDLQAVHVDNGWRSDSWGMAMGPQPSLALELTAEGSEGRLILFAGRERSDEVVTQEEIAKFLAPFHVGPER